MQYAWFIWSLILLLVWLLIYLYKKPLRKEIIMMSLWTMPFGLTEPLFVPEYWNPPSLFNLAEKTGFDIESLIFTFAIGGIGSVLYKLIFKTVNEPFHVSERGKKRHMLHFYSFLLPPAVFLLLAFSTNLNHIYCGSISLFVGAVAAVFCRPDLKYKIGIGGFLFVVLYFFFFESLITVYPNYVSQVWNFTSISDARIFRVPITEVMWGFTFGMFWSSLYEHKSWNLLKPIRGFKRHAQLVH